MFVCWLWVIVMVVEVVGVRLCCVRMWMMVVVSRVVLGDWGALAAGTGKQWLVGVAWVVPSLVPASGTGWQEGATATWPAGVLGYGSPLPPASGTGWRGGAVAPLRVGVAKHGSPLLPTSGTGW